jgi:hypothetical protein
MVWARRASVRCRPPGGSNTGGDAGWVSCTRGRVQGGPHKEKNMKKFAVAAITMVVIAMFVMSATASHLPAITTWDSPVYLPYIGRKATEP